MKAGLLGIAGGIGGFVLGTAMASVLGSRLAGVPVRAKRVLRLTKGLIVSGSYGRESLHVA